MIIIIIIWWRRYASRRHYGASSSSGGGGGLLGVWCKEAIRGVVLGGGQDDGRSLFAYMVSNIERDLWIPGHRRCRIGEVFQAAGVSVMLQPRKRLLGGWKMKRTDKDAAIRWRTIAENVMRAMNVHHGRRRL